LLTVIERSTTVWLGAGGALVSDRMPVVGNDVVVEGSRTR
jgi:hypothetical protein